MQKKFLLFTLLIFSLFSAEAQVTIGSGTQPNENSLLDLNENGDGTSTKGILFPRVSLISIGDPSPLSSHVEGMVVYNIATSDSSIDAKSAVSPGTYYNDGNSWILVSSTDKNPWNNSETLAPASSISDPIYHTGAVTVGAVENDPSAQMQVSSNNKGVLIPRISTTARDVISEPANGLMIFNTTTNCLNYYNETNNRWLNLCGGYDPATIVVLCETSEGPVGVYTAGSGLNTTNLYRISVNVTSVGTYEIVAKTENGYTFAKSGLFTSTGTNVIELEGQGAPIKEGTDAITLQNNGVSVSLTCALPTITVNPASIRYTVDPSSYTVYGTYYTGIGLDATNYIEVELNVTNGGILNLTSAAENGISFSSGSVTLEPGVQKVRLYGQGTPIKAGSFTGNIITDENGNSLQPTVNVLSTKGTFDDPINRCQEILDDNPDSPSDYYWIQDTSGKKFLTYCMMEDGSAWTLVKSMSENQIFTYSNPTALQNEGLYNQTERNVTSTKNGVFNEYWFALSSATINNIGVTGGKNIKYTIKQNGHTTDANATMDNVKSTTVPATEDAWALENYWNVTILTGNAASAAFTGAARNHTSEGKMFGKTFNKPSETAITYYFDGVAYTGAYYGFCSISYYTGFYGALGNAGSNNANSNVTYNYSTGQTYTYNKYNFNDVFGLYMNSERQMNHHIGTCSNSDDDFGGESYCAAGFTNWRAHKFNARPDGKYEGRVYQVWIK